MNTRVWFWFLGIFLFLGVIFKSPAIVALVTAVLAVMGVARWWQMHSLDGVLYRRRFHYTRGFPGEKIALRMEIENHKFLPLSWLRVFDPWPKPVAPAETGVVLPSHIQDQVLLTNLVSLRWYETARRSYSLELRKRGVYKVGPVQLESGDMFGMYQQKREMKGAEQITCFPALVPLPENTFPAEDPLGDRRASRRLFEDPNQPMGLREYRPEDSFRRVHWPATAHTGQLQVKVYQPVSSKVLTVCLNVSTFPYYWQGYHEGMLEQVIGLSAALASQGLHDGYQVGLISNGCLANSDQPFRIPPGRSPKQLASILQALAGVTPITIGSFESFLMKEIPRVAYGSMLIIVTAITSPELAQTLIRLKRHERRISMISIAQETPPVLPGIRCIHLPYQEKGR